MTTADAAARVLLIAPPPHIYITSVVYRRVPVFSHGIGIRGVPPASTCEVLRSVVSSKENRAVCKALVAPRPAPFLGTLLRPAGVRGVRSIYTTCNAHQRPRVCVRASALTLALPAELR